MSRYALGQPITLPTTVKVAGVLTDAGGISLAVKKPDASQQAYISPVHDGTGLYHQDVNAADLTQLGHYQYVWTSTGAGAGVSFGDFDVFDPFEPAILPLQDAKDALNIPQATTIYDTELQSMVDTVTATIEMVTGGPAYTRTITERVEVSDYYTALVLRKRPVVSVTSITDISSGSALPTVSLDIDSNAAVVRRVLRIPFLSWGPYYTVVYTAGWGTSIPAAFDTAARIIVKHLWQTQRGPSQRPYAGDEDTLLAGMSFAIPNRAMELLRPFTLEAFV